jgi:hypothetical protein
VRIFCIGLLALVATVASIACGSERELEVSAISTNSPVEPNTNARVVARVNSGSVCNITIGEIVRTDVNDPERTQAPKSPEPNGEVSWRFGIPLEAVPQDVPVVINCNRDGQTFTGATTVQVVERTRPVRTETPTASPSVSP